MSAVLVDVATAITAELAAASLGQTFVPARSYADWDEQLEDAGTLHVDVVPVNYDESALDSRESIGYVVSCDVGIRKRFGTDDQEVSTGRIELAEIDDLVLLVEAIHEFFIERRLAGYESAVWRETKIRSAYIRKHLREYRQFTGMIRVSYDVSKAIA